ncbi:MAG: MerR family transcriptional regulator [Oscillospiraceae bacterium]|nr:MerR family transcriptional regulator [Oscillospiraceae bacterium]
MAKFTTGEMAASCNVSVRTVQFYDAKGLLHPSELSEGGRRLYNDDDLAKLRLICTLKTIGLSLDSIKDILASETPGEVLPTLLDDQAGQLRDEIEQRQRQLQAIKIIKDSVQNMTAIPAHSITDIEQMMANKQGLKRVHGIILAVGITSAAIQLGLLVLWIVMGMWIPFAVAMLLHQFVGVLVIRMYYKSTAFRCAVCGETFRISLRQFLLAPNTATSNKLSRLVKLDCPKCEHSGWCVEVYHP